MATVQNVAYDLSRYEQKPLAEKPQLQVIEKQQKKGAFTPIELFRGSVVVGIMVCALCFMLYSNAILTELSDQISRKNERLQVLSSENQRMSAEIEGKMSLRSIESIAQSEIGLAKMEPYQVAYVTRTGEDKIMLTSLSPTESTGNRLSEGVSSFLEYLRISFNNN